MKYAYLILLALSCLLGGYIGHKFFPRTELREVPTTVTKEVVKLKQIVKYADGKVVETEKFVETDKAQVSPQPKPQYRIGALLPVASELKLPTVTASRRLFGEVWGTAQYDVRHKEITIGIDYEF